MMNPVLCDKWYLIKHNDHNMAKAVILMEETLNAVVDKVRAHGKEDGELGALLLDGQWYVTELRQIPSRKP